MDHIYHLSALPGAGKTYHFLNVALNHINQPSLNPETGKPLALIYCAPTLRLLFQTAEALILEYQAKLVREGLEVCLPENLDSLLFLPRNMDSEAEAFQRSALQWGDYMDSLAFPIANQAVHAYLTETAFKYTVPSFDPRRIVFLTHDLFAALKKFPRQQELLVYFDEARMCTSSITNGRGIKVNKGDLRLLQSVFKPKPLFPGSVFGKLSGAWKPDSENLEPLPLANFKLLLKAQCHTETLKSLSMFEAIWNSATNPRLDSFTKIYSEEELQDFEAEAGEDNYLTEFIQIKAPGKLFHGFYRVVLLSAFFPTSEMRYLLERSMRITRFKELRLTGLPIKDARETAKEEVNTWYKRNELPLPSSIKARTKLLEEHRHPKLVLVPILSNKDSIPSLKSLLVDVVVRTEDEQKLISLLDKTPSRMFIRNEVMPNLEVYLTTPRVLQKTDVKVKAFVEALRPNLFYSKPLRFLIDVMLDAVNALEAKRLKDKDYVQKPEVVTPLIVLNTLLKTYVAAKTKEKSFGSPKEYLESVFIKPRKAGVTSALLLKTKTQGVNSYQSHRYVGFFAALNPNNNLAIFYSEFIPEYDVLEDMTIEVAVQAICRSSVRDAKSRDTVYCFVPTREVARRIQSKLGGLPTINESVMHKVSSTILAHSPPGAPEKWGTPQVRVELKRLRNKRLYYEREMKTYQNNALKLAKLKPKLDKVLKEIKRIEATGSLEA